VIENILLRGGLGYVSRSGEPGAAQKVSRPTWDRRVPAARCRWASAMSLRDRGGRADQTALPADQRKAGFRPRRGELDAGSPISSFAEEQTSSIESEDLGRDHGS